MGNLTTSNVCFQGAAVWLGGQLHHHRRPFRSLGEISDLHRRLQHEQKLRFKWEMGVEDTPEQTDNTKLCNSQQNEITLRHF